MNRSIVSPRTAIPCLVLALAIAGVALGGPPAHEGGLYIVRMTEKPAVAYTGGIPGLKATRPIKGQKIDPEASAVVEYAASRDGRHGQALAAVGGGKKHYDYRDLEALEADWLAQVKGSR